MVEAAKKLRDRQKIFEDLITAVKKSKAQAINENFKNALVKGISKVIDNVLPIYAGAVFVKIFATEEKRISFKGKSFKFLAAQKVINLIPGAEIAQDLAKAVTLLRTKNKDFNAGKVDNVFEVLQTLIFSIEPLANVLAEQLEENRSYLEKQPTTSGIYGFRKEVSVADYIEGKLISYAQIRDGLIVAIDNWVKAKGDKGVMPLIGANNVENLLELFDAEPISDAELSSITENKNNED